MPLEAWLLLSGIILLIIEVIIPGFGIFGISGLFGLTVGLYCLMGGGVVSMLAVAGMYIILALGVLFLWLYLPRESKWNPFVLWEKQSNSTGYTGSDDLTALCGQCGTVLTPLRPAGTVQIGRKRFDVSSLGEYIDKGTAVQVIKVEGSKIFVEEVKE